MITCHIDRIRTGESVMYVSFSVLFYSFLTTVRTTLQYWFTAISDSYGTSKFKRDWGTYKSVYSFAKLCAHFIVSVASPESCLIDGLLRGKSNAIPCLQLVTSLTVGITDVVFARENAALLVVVICFMPFWSCFSCTGCSIDSFRFRSWRHTRMKRSGHWNPHLIRNCSVRSGWNTAESYSSTSLYQYDFRRYRPALLRAGVRRANITEPRLLCRTPFNGMTCARFIVGCEWRALGRCLWSLGKRISYFSCMHCTDLHKTSWDGLWTWAKL